MSAYETGGISWLSPWRDPWPVFSDESAVGAVAASLTKPSALASGPSLARPQHGKVRGQPLDRLSEFGGPCLGPSSEATPAFRSGVLLSATKGRAGRRSPARRVRRSAVFHWRTTSAPPRYAVSPLRYWVSSGREGREATAPFLLIWARGQNLNEGLLRLLIRKSQLRIPLILSSTPPSTPVQIRTHLLRWSTGKCRGSAPVHASFTKA